MARKTIVTHDGAFHADDVFAVAVLRLLEPTATVVRTRDSDATAAADFVVDVGGVSDAKQNRFDHHQPEGAGERENGLPGQHSSPARAEHAGGRRQAGIPYAAFGLVWKKFGGELSGSEEAALRVDEVLVSPIDANDNGIDLAVPAGAGISTYDIADAVRAFVPTWREKDADTHAAFLEAVSCAQRIIEREIACATSAVAGAEAVQRAYAAAEDKRLIVLDEDLSWKDILAQAPEPLYCVHPQNGVWRLYCVRDNPRQFVNRKDLPSAWAGLSDQELAAATGVADAVFCHRNRFMAVTKTREGALALAKLALAD